MIQNTDSQQLQNKREQFQVDIRNDSRKAILERRRQRFNTQNIQAQLSNKEIFQQLKNNNQGLDEEEAKENTSYDQAQINVENILQAIEQQINIYTKLKQNFSSLNQDQYLELTNILANLVGLTYNSDHQFQIIDQIISNNSTFLSEMVDILQQDIKCNDKLKIDMMALQILVNMTEGSHKQVDTIQKKISLKEIINLLFKQYFPIFIEDPEKLLQLLEILLQGICNLMQSKNTFKIYFVRENLLDQLFQLLNIIPDNKQFMQISKYMAEAILLTTEAVSSKEKTINLAYLQILTQKFNQSNDLDMKIDFLWALYYISLNQIKTNLNIDNQESIDCFLKNDALQIIKFSLNYDDQRIQEGALNLLGNLLLGKQQQNKIVFEKLIELGVMAKLIQFLNGINRQFRILCLRIVNNMVEIEGVTQSVYLQNIFPVLIQRISQDDSSIQRECYKILLKLMEENDQISQVFVKNFSLLERTIQIIKENSLDPDLILLSLKFLKKCLDFENQEQFPISEVVIREIEEADALSIIENLSNSKNKKTSEIAGIILDKINNFQNKQNLD